MWTARFSGYPLDVSTSSEGVGPQVNKVEPVPSDVHRVLVAGIGGAQVWCPEEKTVSSLDLMSGGGGSLPCDLSHDASDAPTLPQEQTDSWENITFPPTGGNGHFNKIYELKQIKRKQMFAFRFQQI